MKLLYLLIDVSVIALPLLASFHSKILFHKTWRELFKAILWVAVPFLILDSIFTSLGIWSFNTEYITGIRLFNLPIEEVLFFISIPYACIFTYYCLDKFYDFSWNLKSENIFCILLSTFLLISGLLFWQNLYTSSTFISTALLCLFLKFGLHINWFGKAVSIFGILLFPFLLVNGMLTGTGLSAPVVRYNLSDILGIRIMTIPVEDFIYGFELFLGNLALYLRFTNRFSPRHLHNCPVGIESEKINNSGKYRAV
jgi:lycopene cyclase domain-containing protein